MTTTGQLPTLRRASTAATERATDRPAADTTAATARVGTSSDATAATEIAHRGAGMFTPGLVLGRYRLKARLGAGAFGVVWMAEDERLGREVAVKMLPRERVVGGRFEREARATARLGHPGIVTLYEAAVDDDGAYLVSELVRGETLHTLLAEGRVSDRDIVAIALSLCDALDHAHGAGIVHRDVKPSNVLVPERPSSAAHPAKLTDFGVARVIGGDSLTRTGDIVGTAAYMAPEQAEGLRVGPATDLYALALVTYEALTGVNPVRTGVVAGRPRRLGTYLPPLRRQRRDLPRELGRGIDLALRPRARERGTLDDLRMSLAAVVAELDDTPGVVEAPRLRPRFAPRPDTDEPELPPLHPGAGPDPDSAAGGRHGRDHSAATTRPDVRLPVPRPHPARRGINAAAAGLACGWLTVHALGSPVPPEPAGMLAALAVLVVPRLGWLVMSTVLIVTALLSGHLEAGLLLLALFAPLAALPRRGTLWGLPTAAPALGLIGLGGAWPGVAAVASASALRRAALGGLGWLWLAIAGELTSGRLQVVAPLHAGAPAWLHGFARAVSDVFVPMLGPSVLAPAVLWALAAAVLPWLLHRISLAADALAVALWAGGVFALTEALSTPIGHGRSIVRPDITVLSVLVGALCALAPSLLAARSRAGHAPGSQTDFA